jgi:hypothetical protein
VKGVDEPYDGPVFVPRGDMTIFQWLRRMCEENGWPVPPEPPPEAPEPGTDG